MFKIYTLVFLIMISFAFGQNKSFIYELHFKPNPAKDSTAKENFILDINGNRSMFRTVEDKKQDSTYYSGSNSTFMSTSFKDLLAVSKDLEKKETYKFIIDFQKLFTIKVEDELDWKIENDIKEISGMKMQKAMTTYGGRKWIAWFTNEIPLHEGPYIFHGLPGLITEVSDVENNFHFSLIQVKNSGGKLYEKGKSLSITWKQFEKLALDYYADPTREINGKSNGNGMFMVKWQDENGNEFTPNFKEMNDVERKAIRQNNNPIEVDHKILYK